MICFLTGCSEKNDVDNKNQETIVEKVNESNKKKDNKPNEDESKKEVDELEIVEQKEKKNSFIAPTKATKPFDISMVEEFSGTPYQEINNNIPYFTQDEITNNSFEQYNELDNLGRCTYTIASIGKDLMPIEERGSIGMIKPSGWHTIRYDDLIADKYLYNRCHLIGYQLTGENANEQNLITGTRYMNIEGMLPFENMTADYIKETNNHVMYRSTPIFEDDNLVADGVLMKAWSVEDNGKGICFCVFVYNVQPGINIDYASGDSSRIEEKNEEAVEEMVIPEQSQSVVEEQQSEEQTVPDENVSGQDYIINTNTGKFHYPWCSSVNKMSEKNKWYYTGNRDDIVNMGYEPCKRCNP